MPSTVFISHSSRDGKVAQALCEALERRGAPCWISSRDVGPGENFQEAIVRALRRSSLMVLVFSSNANNSNEIKKEIAIASQQKLVVIPVRVEDVPPSDAFAYEFAIRQWIDLFNDWDRSLDRLVAQVKTIQTDQGDGDKVDARSNWAPPSPQPQRQSSRALLIALAAFGLIAVSGAIYGLRDRLFPPPNTEGAPQMAQLQRPAPTAANAEQQATSKPSQSTTDVAVAARPQDSQTNQASVGETPPARPQAAPTPIQDTQTTSASQSARNDNAATNIGQQTNQAIAANAKAADAPGPSNLDVASAPANPQTTPSQPTEAQPPSVLPPTALPPPRNEIAMPASAAIAAEPPPLDQIGQGGQIFQECEKCPQMVVIPSGASMLGSPPNEAGRQSHELPPTEVSFAAPFAVGRFDVSFEQWDACAAEGGCNNWRPGDFGWGRGRRPVIFVSWADAQAYVAWLSVKTGQPYHLLSEAEWEYAARGCRTARCVASPFWFQSGIKPELANYDSRYSYAGSPKAQAARKTVPVDDGVANPFGLIHIIGNVRKWMSDCWRLTSSRAPADAASRPAAECPDHAVRGGSWGDEPKDLRAGARSWAETNERAPQIGFRVARTLTP